MCINKRKGLEGNHLIILDIVGFGHLGGLQALEDLL